MLEHRVRVAAPVDMADHGRTILAAAPIVAGQVDVVGKRAPLHVGAGQDVVLVGRVADAVDDRALLRQAGFLGDLVAVAVQVVDAGGDDHAFGVLPGAAADAVAGIDGGARIGRIGAAAEIGVPGVAAGADRLG